MCLRTFPFVVELADSRALNPRPRKHSVSPRVVDITRRYRTLPGRRPILSSQHHGLNLLLFAVDNVTRLCRLRVRSAHENEQTPDYSSLVSQRLRIPKYLMPLPFGALRELFLSKGFAAGKHVYDKA